MWVPESLIREDLLVRLHEQGHVADYTELLALPHQGHTGDAHRDLLFRMLAEIAVDARCPVDIRARHDAFDWASIPIPDTQLERAAAWLNVAYDMPGSGNPLLRLYVSVLETLLPPDVLAVLRAAVAAVVADPSVANRMDWADKLAAIIPRGDGEDGADGEGADGEGEDHAGSRSTRAESGDGAAPPDGPHAAPPQLAPEAARLREDRERYQARQRRRAARRERRAALHHPDAEYADYVDAASGGARIEIHRHATLRRGERVGRGGERAADQGTVMRRPARVLTDGLAYTVPARPAGGILMDWSGSMRYSQEIIRDAVAQLPGLWAGGYAEHADMRWRTGGYTARLCIVAQHGRVGTVDWWGDVQAAVTGENNCDALVLRYFGRTVRGPKVWVSDGRVYGEYGHSTDCDRACRQYGIVRVLTVGDAVAYLRRQTVCGWPARAVACMTNRPPTRIRLGSS
jgi:hypothetical protein